VVARPTLVRRPLDLDWRRRTPAERQAVLDVVGLTGAFWSLTQ